MRSLGWWCTVLCVLSQVFHTGHAQLSVTAVFDQQGVRGTIKFSQQGPSANTTIVVNLTGLENFESSGPFPWHVHEYPFPHDAQRGPCRAEVTGGHYDPLGANTGPDYAANCASNVNLCELGDISGRFGNLTSPFPQTLSDPFLSLYGIYTIIGRSIVLHNADNSRLVCANIGYPTSDGQSPPQWLYVPFRERFTGSIFFRQHTNASTASVYSNLRGQSSSESSLQHNWHVHDCHLDAMGDCVSAGPHYNPRNVNITSPQYPILCSPLNQSNCEIGDQSGKGGTYDVVGGRIAHFYTDTDLPLLGEQFSIDGRSVVIHAANRGGPRIACANISQFVPLRAEAVFTASQGSPISGSIVFTQDSPFDPTSVAVSLMGLGGGAGGYHVHVTPIGPVDRGFPARCGGNYTGGHWNPLGVVYTDQTPTSSDGYEVGDLSGKFGGLQGRNQLVQMYSDPNIPLFGPLGIIGRSVVIHRDDQDGTRWACADIVHARPVVRVTFSFNSSQLVGRVTFTQLADDPNSPTTIAVELDVRVDLEPPPPPTTTTTMDQFTSTAFSTPAPSVVMTPSPSTALFTPVFSSSVVTVSSSQLLSSSAVEAGLSSQPPTPMVSSAVDAVSSQLPIPPSSSAVEEAFQSSFIPLSSSPAVSLPPMVSTPSMVPSDIIPTPSPSATPPSDLLPSIDTSMLMLDPTTVPLPLEFSLSTDSDLFFSTLAPSPTPIPMSGRRRRSSAEHWRRSRRQANADSPVAFSWSLRAGQVTDPASCGALPLLGGSAVSPELCSMDNPLSCSAGDLTAKHGILDFPPNPGPLRMVFTDPNLPLSGPNAAFGDEASPSGALLIQPMEGATQSEVVLCNAAPQLQPPPPPTTPPPTTPPATPQTTVAAVPPPGANIGAIVGGIIAGIVGVVLVILLLVLLLFLAKRKGSSKYELDKATKMEMGPTEPSKPVLGVPNYKVLHRYEPQNEGDLALSPGEWVTLEETPYGGGWWKGAIDDGKPGWFPKTYVKYVDREAERKKKQEESFTLAAAAIMDASTSFGPSVATRRNTEIPNSTKKKGKSAKRAHTFSKKEIDSTPKMLTKFDKPYVERDDVMVIENTMKEGGSQSGGSCPETPNSYRRNEIFANAQATESGSSQEDNPKLDLTLEGILAGEQDLMSHADKHLAKYDFAGTTDIELQFSKGSVIYVIEKADNGWWQGVCTGQVGWFPESYIDPTPIRTKTSPSEGRGQGEGKEQGQGHTEEARDRAESASSAADVEKPRNMDEMMGAAGGDLEALEYRAIYSYQSDAEGDLVFGEGDTVLVYWGQDNGWWYGAFGGRQGWFPESYVEPVIDTSLPEAAGAAEASPNQKEELPVVSEPSSGVKAAGGAERAPSSISQDSGVGQEEIKDENKPEESSAGIQDELASVLSSKKKDPEKESLLPSPTKKEESPQVSPSASDEAVPSKPDAETKDEPAKKKVPPPATNKPKSLKARRQSAPASRNRRAAPPPPKAPGQKVPPTISESSPVVPRSPTSVQDPAKAVGDEKKKEEEEKPQESAKVVAADEAPPTTKPTVTTPTAPKPSGTIPKPPTTKVPPPKQKRRTTAIDNSVKPRRRPPPPAPQALLEAASAAAAANSTSSKSAESSAPSKPAESAAVTSKPTEKVAVELKAVDDQKEKVETPVSTPVPPPRAKARMKKVKRPTSRLIPPPPSIPLPPPPKKKVSPLMTSVTAEGNSKPALHSPTDVGTPTQVRTPKGPRPPPPKRISSLGPVSPTVPASKASKQPTLTEVQEETTADDKPPTRQASLKQPPPKRPPPPRPTNPPPSNESVGGDKKSEKPSRPPPASSTNPEGGSGIHPRGSSLMGSLKKLVKRDSKKNGKPTEVGGSSEESASSNPQKPPQRPSHPPRRTTKKKNITSTAAAAAAPDDSSPVPRPRKKKSVSSPNDVPSEGTPSVSQTSNPPPPRPSNAPGSSAPPTQTNPSRPSLPPSQQSVAAADRQQEQAKAEKSLQDKPPSPSPADTDSKPKEAAGSQSDRRKSTNIPSKPKPPLAPKPSHGTKPAATGSATTPTSPEPTNFYRATKAYTGKTDEELSFSPGDTLIFMEKKEGGFYYGMLDNGTTGLFPVNCTEPFLKK